MAWNVGRGSFEVNAIIRHGGSHVDAVRTAGEGFEPTETSRDEADEARPQTVITGIGADTQCIERRDDVVPLVQHMSAGCSLRESD